jgi:pimeloyl-ACP methyl ester carboxylesterase
MSEATHEMGRAAVDGLQLEYELQGRGEPVVLIHWGLCAAWAEPFIDEPVLADHFRLMSYHRAGFAGSDQLGGPVSMAAHAAHCARLLRHLGIERAHIVGHSSSAVIALQLALDFRARCTRSRSWSRRGPSRRPRSRPDLSAISWRPRCSTTAPATRPALSTPSPGRSSDRTTVARWSRESPGVFEQALADADAFFAQDLRALQQWSFTQEDARRVTQPTLAVHGENTAPTFPERLQLLVSWLPNVEPVELPGATHLLHVQNAQGMARALASFCARHPLMASTA